MFTKKSFACIYWLQIKAAQHMLDFDFLSWREPSVLCFVSPLKPQSAHKLFYWDTELLIQSFPDFSYIPEDIQSRLDTLINFSSFRSSWGSTIQAMESRIFKNIIMIAEGIPERQTLEIIEKNKTHKLNIVWPATVGAMSAGVFRAWNTGWSLDNIIESYLYQPWSVGFVSKSWWMSNELRRVIADRTNGTSLSIALWGDKYNIMDFPQAMEIMQNDDSIKMIVMLWEIWWKDELIVAEMIEKSLITKPVVAWCIGTINEQIGGEVQFGHAGAKSNKEHETASFKNEVLRKAWAFVPQSYMDFGDVIENCFQKLQISKSQAINISHKIPMLQNRKKTLFTSTISDERWEELLYNWKKISEFIDSPWIWKILGHLWLKKDLPEYASKFLDTVIMLIADHWPAVSGATNAIITSRAGNDIKSSLIAWLSTVGPLFWWAIDGAAKYWFECIENEASAEDFITHMKEKWENIPGIGHKVKSRFNPDKRCEILEEISHNFPVQKHLLFAKEVETFTLEKKANLILNVDGYIAAMLLDIFDDIWFSTKEKHMYIQSWIFNGLFLLARSIGFIGHALDQKRLWEWLYRTPWDDILYSDD